MMFAQYFKSIQHQIRTSRRQGDDGFTMTEVAIAIPLLALISSTVLYFMSLSIITVNENDLALEAADTVEELFDTAAAATTCNELRALAAEDGPGNSIYNEDTREEYALITTIEYSENPLDGMDVATENGTEAQKQECNNVGSIAEIETQAVILADDEEDEPQKVLYRAERTVQLTGGLAIL